MYVYVCVCVCVCIYIYIKTFVKFQSSYVVVRKFILQCQAK